MVVTTVIWKKAENTNNNSTAENESFENEILVDNSEQENDIPRDNELNVDNSDHIYENV